MDGVNGGTARANERYLFYKRECQEKTPPTISDLGWRRARGGVLVTSDPTKLAFGQQWSRAGLLPASVYVSGSYIKTSPSDWAVCGTTLQRSRGKGLHSSKPWLPRGASQEPIRSRQAPRGRVGSVLFEAASCEVCRKFRLQTLARSRAEGPCASWERGAPRPGRLHEGRVPSQGQLLSVGKLRRSAKHMPTIEAGSRQAPE